MVETIASKVDPMAAREKIKTKRRNATKRAAPKAREPSTKPKDAKIQKLISNAAEKGVIKLVADDPTLKKAYLRKLDFSPASVKIIDGLIKKFWKGKPPSDQYFDTMVWAFGAYVAEVIQRNHEGSWEKLDGVYQFLNPAGFTVCPWVWVRKRFEDADELLAAKYDVVMKMADNFEQAASKP